MGLFVALTGRAPAADAVLPPLPVFGVAVFAVLAFLAVRCAAAYLRLRQFGGPRWTGVSNWPHSVAMLQNRCHEWYEEANRKYGPIARVAPNVLVTSSPDVWAHVNNKAGYKRSDWYYNACRIEHRRDNVFSQTDVAKHDLRRKQMAPGYSGRENLHLESSIDERLAEFLALIRAKYVSSPDRPGVPLDLGEKVQFFTLDVISGVGLGRPFGMLASDSDVDQYLRSSEDGLRAANAALALGVSWLAHTPLVGRLIAPSPRDGNGFGRMMATCFRYVDARAADPTDKRSDMLASFIRNGLAGDELRSEALEQIIAGSDTTSTGIRGALLHIITNPRVYARLQREVDEAVATGLAPATGSGGIVSLAQTRQLPYLQAVIREALRIWPPAVNIFSRDVPPGGDTVLVDGAPVFLPGGASIGYSAYAMHHSEAIYGADAKAFRPERWLVAAEEDPDRHALMLRTNELVFGHGKYQCLGKPVAQLELAKTIFELLRNFDMTLVHPTKPWDARNTLGLFVISDMWVHVTERPASAPQ
ncbi:cytochrome P450 52A11 [Purpureocillium lilacinum]|uniref:Cytochrome P450 monooxygenase ABA1 n=1 Tax=Purpureocillium lilacinum TaxID=33203 RepID=A0A179HLW6_PURLI|nr:cytochrome P450 52A11 [Purpureocillium lilacinum]OAQ90363.1 cytochrome P450 52A11 [Purpureocillium lilacinum]